MLDYFYYQVIFSVLFLIFWLGIIPAVIAHIKGHSFLGWWLFGISFFIIALPLAITLEPTVQAREKSALSAGGRKCPHCAEIIKQEAKVCRFCGRDVEQLPDPNDYSVLEQKINPSELNESGQYYYKRGLNFMREGLSDNAKLEFLKAIQVSSPKSKWYSSSQARLLEMRVKNL
jgi:hypothetical protein